MSKKKFQYPFLFSVLIFLATLSGCSREHTYKAVTYGGSFLFDSVTVGFLRSEYKETKGDGAWDWATYSDGNQDLILYSVPRKKIISTTRLQSDCTCPIYGSPIVYGKPWLMYKVVSGNLILHNFETGEKISFMGSNIEPGGISPDGEYAFFKDHDTTTVYSMFEEKILNKIYSKNIFYLSKDAEYYLHVVWDTYNPKSIIKETLTGENRDTLYNFTGNEWFWRVTDFSNCITLSTRSNYSVNPKYCNLDSLINHKVFVLLESIYMISSRADISLSSGIYTFDSGTSIYIKNYFNIYTDTLFTASSTEE